MTYVSFFRRFMIGAPICAFALCACDSDPASDPAALDIVWDFSNGNPGVTPMFADYSTETEVDDEAGPRDLPAELGAGQGYMLSGFNRSDDLWMSMSAPIRGLSSTTAYTLTATITVATDAPAGCAGVGGAPDSVFLKVGAIDRAPTRSLVEDHYRTDYDKGAQSEGGSEVSRVPGDLGNSRDCADDPEYESLVRTHTHPNSVRPNADGTLWIVVGTDSGFESRTTLYYQKAEFGLVPVRP